MTRLTPLIFKWRQNMRNTLLASAIAPLLLAAGFASAGENTANVELEFTVESSCYLYADELVAASTDGFTGHGGGVMSAGTTGSGDVLMDFACNAGLPFTLETNADVGGMYELVGDSTGTTVPVRIVFNDAEELPFGSVANGEARSFVGTGQVEQMNVGVYFNEDASGTPQPLPAVDIYRSPTPLVITQTF